MKRKRKSVRGNYLKTQINYRLDELDRIGESRHDAKMELIKENGSLPFGETVEGIYSISTKDNYRKVANHFTRYCVKEKGEDPRANLQDLIKKYSIDYLHEREARGLSPSTLSKDRAALNKISVNNRKIDYEVSQRKIENITRSRSNRNTNNKHFNEDNNSDLVALAKGTGGRRSDLASLTPKSFFKRSGRLFVRFEGSKGGRNRIAVVREEYREKIESRIASTASDLPLFARVHSHADIHSYRREYAQELYKDILRDKSLKSALSGVYPKREENIQSDLYTTQGQDNVFTGYRDDIFLVSQSLGHNRLDVAVNHYLR